MYYTDKIFYLLVMMVSESASIPVFYIIHDIRKDQFRTVAATGIIGLPGIFSLVVTMTYPLDTKPVIAGKDVIFTQKTEAYLQKNTIPCQNLSIPPGAFNGT